MSIVGVENFESFLPQYFSVLINITYVYGEMLLDNSSLKRVDILNIKPLYSNGKIRFLHNILE